MWSEDAEEEGLEAGSGRDMVGDFTDSWGEAVPLMVSLGFFSLRLSSRCMPFLCLSML